MNLENQVNLTGRLAKENQLRNYTLNGEKHPAIMPEQIPYRLIKMYSFVNDIVLDTTISATKYINNTNR